MKYCLISNRTKNIFHHNKFPFEIIEQMQISHLSPSANLSFLISFSGYLYLLSVNSYLYFSWKIYKKGLEFLINDMKSPRKKLGVQFIFTKITFNSYVISSQRYLSKQTVMLTCDISPRKLKNMSER